ncbi:MAG: hypothetical protein ABH873_06145 [Candidatus Firestonebacteria bacterium]
MDFESRISLLGKQVKYLMGRVMFLERNVYILRDILYKFSLKMGNNKEFVEALRQVLLLNAKNPKGRVPVQPTKGLV